MWREHGQQAYKGAAVAGFPNLFVRRRPEHRPRAQLDGLHDRVAPELPVDALRTIDEHGLATFEVREDAQRAYNDKLQTRMARTIWTTGGCASWYLDEHGNNTTLWPGFTFAFRQLTRRFDADAYDDGTAPTGRSTMTELGMTASTAARSP